MGWKGKRNETCIATQHDMQILFRDQAQQSWTLQKIDTQFNASCDLDDKKGQLNKNV